MGPVARAPFLASRDGFAFRNSWPNQPAVTLDTPFGDITVGNASKGLCGGMAFAALDYWYADRTPPADKPDRGTPLYDFIVKRIIDSWDVPTGIMQYYQWMTLPDADDSFTAFGRDVVTRRGVAWRTATQQWPAIRADLDRRVPVPLGLVIARSKDPRRLSWNHQVLAYAYDLTGSRVDLRVYDPNSAQSDDVRISFDTADPGDHLAVTHNVRVSRPIRGLFRATYAPVKPPAA